MANAAMVSRTSSDSSSSFYGMVNGPRLVEYGLHRTLYVGIALAQTTPSKARFPRMPNVTLEERGFGSVELATPSICLSAAISHWYCGRSKQDTNPTPTLDTNHASSVRVAKTHHSVVDRDIPVSGAPQIQPGPSIRCTTLLASILSTQTITISESGMSGGLLTSSGIGTAFGGYLLESTTASLIASTFFLPISDWRNRCPISRLRAHCVGVHDSEANAAKRLYQRS